MINFDDYANEIKQSTIQSGNIFQIIHTEYSLLVVQDQEKQMHY